jgi:hypothetical protein
MNGTAVTLVFLAALAIAAADLGLRLALRGRRAKQEGEPPAASGLVRWLRVAVNLVGLASLFFVASTAFSALLANENGLTGGRLIWHVGFAPPFALAAVAVTLFWAHRNRFSAADWRRLAVAGGWAIPLRKLFFWIAVALTVPTMLSILAAMFPLFPSEEQQSLVQIHRYCALPLTAAGFLFAYFALVAWRARSRD